MRRQPMVSVPTFGRTSWMPAAPDRRADGHADIGDRLLQRRMRGGRWSSALAPEAFPLIVNRQEPQGDCPLHRHDFSELVIVTGGEGSHRCEDDAYDLAAGDAYVVAGWHGYAGCRGLRLVNVIFDPARLGLPLAEARMLPGWHAFFALEPRLRRSHGFRSRLRLDRAALAEALAIVADIERSLDNRRPGAGFVATAHLMRLIDLLARAYARRAGAAPDARQLLRLGRVLGLLEARVHRTVRLGALARMAGMSERSFLRSFRAATGHSPIDWLIRQRLARGAERLRAGSAVTEAALAAGFADPAYFSRQFRRVFGMAPSRWRAPA